MDGDKHLIAIFAVGFFLAFFSLTYMITPETFQISLNTSENQTFNFDVSVDEGYNITIDRQSDAIIFTHQFQPGEEIVYIQEYRGVVKNDPFWYKNSFRYKVAKDTMRNFPDAFGFTIITGTSTYSRTITSTEITGWC